MVYYRKYRRTGRGYARRGRKGYSMYKLYKSRSSAAQSRQIYGLNRKINRIERMTKPEIKIAPLVQQSITDTTEAGTLVNGVRIFPGFNLTNLLGDTDATVPGYARLDGKFARLQNITMKGVFTYNISDSTSDQQRMVGYMRIVLVQTKTTRDDTPPYNTIFSTNVNPDSTGTTALTSFSMIRAPLKSGSSRVVKILSDKTYMLSDTRQAVNIKTKLRYLRNWYINAIDDRPKGQVYMYVMLYNQDTTAGADNVSHVAFNFVSKCVYTDA